MPPGPVRSEMQVKRTHTPPSGADDTAHAGSAVRHSPSSPDVGTGDADDRAQLVTPRLAAGSGRGTRRWTLRRGGSRKYAALATQTPSATVQGKAGKAGSAAAAGEGGSTGEEAEAKPKPTPLPKKIISVLFVVQLCEAYGITVLFPFVVFMIRDYGVEEASVGYYAGILSAVFSLSQFLSAPGWGWMSDKTSRRFTLHVGLMGSAAASLVFGMAPSFWMAMLGRSLSGLLNGNVGVMKALLSDMTDDSNRAVAFSMLPAAWGLGCVLGPVCGGMLSQPSRQYGGDWGIFTTFPYLPPMVAGVVLQMIAFCALFLVPNPKPSPISVCVDRCRGARGGGNRGRYGRVVELGEMRAARHDGEADDGAVGASGDIDVVVSGSDSEHNDGTTATRPASSVATTKGARPGKPATAREVLCNCTVFGAVASYMGMALSYTLLDELVPVWASAHVRAGGLDFTPAQIGVLLTTSGVSLLVICLLIMPFLASRMTYKQMLFWGTALAAPAHFMLPATQWLLGTEHWVVWVVLVTYYFYRMVLANLGFTAAMIFVNNSVTRPHLGMVNGFAQSLGALVRALGPAMGGSLWSLGVTLDFPGHAFMAFAVVFLLQAGCAVLALVLPKSLEKQRVDPNEQEEGSGGAGAADAAAPPGPALAAH